MGNGTGKRNAEGRRLQEFYDKKELCVANTLFYKVDKKKSLIALVEVKQNLILGLWEKIQQVCKACESDSIIA